MKAFEGFSVEPSVVRNSLILTGLTLRTFSTAVSDPAPFPPIQLALATRSPLKGVGPDVILNVALTLWSRAIVVANVLEVLRLPSTSTVHCASGRARLIVTSETGAPLVLV